MRDIYTHPELDRVEARLARKVARVTPLRSWRTARRKARRLAIRLTAQLEGHASPRRPE